MTRVKKKVISNVTRDQAETAMAEFAKSANDLSAIEAKMNSELAAIREKYQDRITELNDKKDEQFEVLEVFANETNESWGKKKSLDLVHGTIGFRTGTPKLKYEKGFNGKSVVAILAEKFPDYVRTVTEINKEKLIADRENDGFQKLCEKAHISIDQDETFFVESKSEALQPS